MVITAATFGKPEFAQVDIRRIARGRVTRITIFRLIWQQTEFRLVLNLLTFVFGNWNLQRNSLTQVIKRRDLTGSIVRCT